MKRNIAILTGLTFLLFWRVFTSGLAIFANDGPYSLLKNHKDGHINEYGGTWQNLSWLGTDELAAVPNITNLFFLSFPVEIFAKLYAPLTILFFGISALFLARAYKLTNDGALLCGVTALFCSNPISYATWGLPPQTLAMGLMLCIFALAVKLDYWRATVIGLLVGLIIAEAADVGILYSMFVGLYFLYKAATEKSLLILKYLGVIVGVSALVSLSSFQTLFETQIAGTGEKPSFDFLTGWSFPPSETVRLFIPGIFGYRTDSPGEAVYWGDVGPVGGRFSGNGEYVGIIPLVLGGWILLKSIFQKVEDRMVIWFFGVVTLGSLILSYGRFTPIYQYVVKLPFFDSMRCPIKFLHVFTLCAIILLIYATRQIFGKSKEPKGV